jgi:RNA polymerase sigma-70 factor, ECF subfamily
VLLPEPRTPSRKERDARRWRRQRRIVDDELTAHQRRVFTAIVVDQVPLDVLAAEMGLLRNAVYKLIYDARRKIRRAPTANGYLDEPRMEQR